MWHVTYIVLCCADIRLHIVLSGSEICCSARILVPATIYRNLYENTGWQDRIAKLWIQGVNYNWLI